MSFAIVLLLLMSGVLIAAAPVWPWSKGMGYLPGIVTLAMAAAAAALHVIGRL